MSNNYFQRLPWLRSAPNASKNAGLQRQARPNLQVVYGGCHDNTLDMTTVCIQPTEVTRASRQLQPCMQLYRRHSYFNQLAAGHPVRRVLTHGGQHLCRRTTKDS
jgi:hypothetical protein